MIYDNLAKHSNSGCSTTKWTLEITWNKYCVDVDRGLDRVNRATSIINPLSLAVVCNKSYINSQYQ